MAKQNQNDLARFIYNKIDEILLQLDFFQYSRHEAFIHSFGFLEAIQNNMQISSKNLGNMILNQREFEDSKKYLIYWIYKHCQNDGYIASSRDFDTEKITKVINLARNFSNIHDSIVSFQKGWMNCDYIKEEKKFIFEYSDPEKGLLFFNNYFRHKEKESRRMSEIQDGFGETSRNKDIFKQFANTVKVTRDNQLRYSTNENIKTTFEKSISILLEKIFILPEDWSIGPYSIKDIRLVWIQINKLCLIRNMAYLLSTKSQGNYDNGKNALFEISKVTLINYLAKYISTKKKQFMKYYQI